MKVVTIGFPHDLSVSAMRALTLHGPRDPAPKRQAAEPHTSGKRHAMWTEHEASRYKCIRQGRAFGHLKEIDDWVERGSLREEDFWLFQHKDTQTARHDLIPRYEALYKCDNRWFKVKKDHLKRAYAASGRTDYAQAWCTDASGLPYWVDRHAFCKERQNSYSRKRSKKEEENY